MNDITKMVFAPRGVIAAIVWAWAVLATLIAGVVTVPLAITIMQRVM